MVKTMNVRRLPLVLGACIAALPGCSSKMLPQPAEPAVTAAELRAYCPQVDFVDDTAFYTVYATGAEGNADKVNYQAVLSDVTRTCQYPDGKLVLHVRAAGRVVPGPQFRAGSVTMPIRVRVIQGDTEISSKVYPYTVSLPKGMTTQFIFAGDEISMPQLQKRNVRVYIGFDVRQKAKQPRPDRQEQDASFY